MYNPERDYAYITPTLMCAALNNLEQQGPPEGSTLEDLVGIAAALAEAQRDFVNAVNPVKSLEEGLTRHGFYKFSPALQQALFAAIGEVICGAWFKAVREVTAVGEECPAGNDMARFAATVREFAKRAGVPTYDETTMAEKLRLQNDVLQARINELGRELVAAHQQLAEAKKGS